MAKELVLTQKDLLEEDIKVQLTQNDVLEVIVNEKYNSIKDEISSTNKHVGDILAKREKLIRDIKVSLVNNYIKKHKIKVKVDDTTSINLTLGGGDSITVFKVKTDTYKGLTTISNHYHSIKQLDSNEVSLSFTCQNTETNEYHTTVTNINGEFAAKLTKSQVDSFNNIVKEIVESNKKVDEVVKKYDGLNFNYDTLMKDMRVSFNKKLIKGGSPKLRDKIKAMLDIDL